MQTYNNNVLHFAATGNAGASSLPYPASDPYVAAVGGVNNDGTKYAAGNYGAGIAFVGPAQNLLGVDRTGSDGYVSGDYSLGLEGTSFASPYVAGVAALLMSQNPTWPAAAVQMRMEATARDIGASGYDTTYGWGMPNAGAALQTGYWQMFNLSTRSQVNNGDQNLTMGFVVTGSGTKKMLVRAVGPTLSGFGVSGVLGNPTLTIYNLQQQQLANNIER